MINSRVGTNWPNPHKLSSVVISFGASLSLIPNIRTVPHAKENNNQEIHSLVSL